MHVFDDDADLDALKHRSPVELLAEGLTEVRKPLSAAAALRYAHLGEVDYDEIAFRFAAANPAKGPVPLASMPMTRHKQGLAAALGTADAVSGADVDRLSHRLLEAPGDGRFSYRLVDDLICMEARDGPAAGHSFAFPVRHVPKAFDAISEDRDARRAVSASIAGTTFPAIWIPFTEVLARGQFPSFEAWPHGSETSIEPDAHYLFVSHRWLTQEEPDPDGRQARTLCRCLLAALCEAVTVAVERGLHAPRRFCPALGSPVGVHGSELAESLLVNLLRPDLAENGLVALQGAAADLEGLLEAWPTERAAEAANLASVAALVAARPPLRAVLGRLRLWCDYACVPQASAASDERLVQLALGNLAAVEIVGDTVVLLDDPFDYLGRAWCALEAGIADSTMGAPHLLSGSIASDDDHALTFSLLMEDRPHLVWRGVLDTEVFAVQAPKDCVRRLGLSATKLGDVIPVYRQLRDLGAPRKVHVDSGELLTGCYPVFAPRVTRPVGKLRGSTPIDTRRALLAEAWSRRPRPATTDYPPFEPLPAIAPESTCHVAIVAACEGEALLLAAWTLPRIAELSRAMDLPAASVSWLASDIAPVGTFAHGMLQLVPVEAEGLLVIAQGTRLAHCDTTRRLLAGAARAGARVGMLAVDDPQSAVRAFDSDGLEPGRTRNPRGIQTPEAFKGGLFRAQLDAWLEGAT